MIRFKPSIIFAVFGISVTVVAISGCGSLNPFGKKKGKEVDLERGQAMELAEFEPEARFEWTWRTKIGKGLGKKYVSLAPQIIGDMIIAADAYGMVEAHNRFSGRTVWKKRIGTPRKKGFMAVRDRADTSFVTAGLAYGDGMLLLGTTRGDVIALSPSDGSELWRTRVSSEVLAPPAVDSEIVATQTADGKLHALDRDDGSTRWVYDSQVPPLTLRGTASPVLADGLVFAGFSNGILLALDAKSGGAVWEQRISLPGGSSEIERLVDVDGTPLLLGHIIVASSYQGVTKAMLRRDGRVLWELDIPSFLPATSGWRQVYVVTDRGIIKAIDQEQAKVNWQVDSLQNRGLSAPLVFGNYLAVSDRFGYIHIIAQSDGRFIARRKLKEGIRSPMAYRDGVLYVLANNGFLYSFTFERIESPSE